MRCTAVLFCARLTLVDFHKNWHTNISILLKSDKIYLQSI